MYLSIYISVSVSLYIYLFIYHLPIIFTDSISYILVNILFITYVLPSSNLFTPPPPPHFLFWVLQSHPSNPHAYPGPHPLHHHGNRRTLFNPLPSSASVDSIIHLTQVMSSHPWLNDFHALLNNQNCELAFCWYNKNHPNANVVSGLSYCRHTLPFYGKSMHVIFSPILLGWIREILLS